jgi:cyclopropane fatty-acyl-phospholipid synthase-like methyltransferase
MRHLCEMAKKTYDGCRCGWGSGALYFAEMFPNSTITAFCDLRTQKEYIDNVAESKGFTNLTVIAGDVMEYEFEPSSYDRVVAVELFEHMKNYQLLLSKIARVLRPGGKLFVHMFAHHSTPYNLEPGWLTDHFLANGTMLSADLLLYFQDDLQVKRQWWVNGMHYAKTCEDWLTKMWGKKKEIENSLRERYGEERVITQWNWWQTFCIAYAELFAYEGGEAWGVSHYLFGKKVERDGEVVKTGT